MTTSFRLSGLTCGSCAKLAELKLKRLPGVETVAVSADGAGTITSLQPVDPAAIEQALAETPYRVIQADPAR